MRTKCSQHQHKLDKTWRKLKKSRELGINVVIVALAQCDDEKILASLFKTIIFNVNFSIIFLFATFAMAQQVITIKNHKKHIQSMQTFGIAFLVLWIF